MRRAHNHLPLPTTCCAAPCPPPLQTRGWFYTLMVLSTALFDKPAFKNLVCNGLVLAADGKKMSKRLKNYPVSGWRGGVEVEVVCWQRCALGIASPQRRPLPISSWPYPPALLPSSPCTLAPPHPEIPKSSSPLSSSLNPPASLLPACLRTRWRLSTSTEPTPCASTSSTPQW